MGVDDFPAPIRARWDFSAVADGDAYLLRRGKDFDIQVASVATAARHWARTNGYRLLTRTKFDERQPDRPAVGLYVRFEADRGST